MRLYDASTTRRIKHEQLINWSRELTFSTRQSGFILRGVSKVRGVYCLYAKNHLFSYENEWGRRHWSRVVYIGSGYISTRLSCHLRYAKNDVLKEFVDNWDLAYRFAAINDVDEVIDYPRAAEATLLHLFARRFGCMPPANRREEFLPDMDCDEFRLVTSANFNPLAYGR